MVNGMRVPRVEVSALSIAMALLKMLLFMSLRVLGLFLSKVGAHNTTLITIERDTPQALQLSSNRPPTNKPPANKIVLTQEIIFTAPKIPRFYHIKVAHKNNLGNTK